MNFSKYLCLCIAFAAFTLVFNAPPAAALSLAEAERSTEKFLGRIVAKDFDGLADDLAGDELFGVIESDSWKQQLAGFKSVYEIVGQDSPVYGFKKLSQKSLGSVLVSNRYAVMLAIRPMLVEIWLYKPNEDWKFFNFRMVFGDEASDNLTHWFDGVD